jgi:hypothetical protein
MTMKKLLFLLVFALAGFASISSVYAQGTGINPSIGSVHKYYVNGTFSTPSSGATSNYTWWISTDPTNLLTRTSLTADFEVTASGAAYNTSTLGSAKGTGIEIKWNPTASTTTPYYLVVQEDGVAPLCTNVKAVAIQPTNNFKLVFEAVASNGTDLTDSPSRCPAPVAVSANGMAITYNYGTDNFMFKLTAQNLYSGWSLVGTFANQLSGTNTIEYQIGGTSGSWLPYSSATVLTVPANINGTETVYFRVTTVNGSIEQNIIEKTVELTLSAVKDAGSNAVTEIKNHNGTVITATPVQKQTVNARPNTSGITTDL